MLEQKEYNSITSKPKLKTMKRSIFLTMLVVLSSLLGFAKAEDVVFGYCNSKNDIAGGQGTVRALIEVDQETAVLYRGMEITKVDFALGTAPCENTKLVILKNKNDLTPLYSQDVASTITDNWNAVELTTPYAVDGTSFFIGYETTVKSGGTYIYALDSSVKDRRGGWYMQWSPTENIWLEGNFSDMSMGVNCIKVTLSGDVSSRYLIKLVNHQLPDFTIKDQAFKITGTIQNTGIDFDSYDVLYQVDGGEVDTFTMARKVTQGSYDTFEINPEPFATAGKHTVKLSFVNTGGQLDEVDGYNTKIFTLSTASKLGTRRVLLENFTGQYCSNCPTGHAYAKEAIKLTTGVDVIWVSHHVGHTEDDFTIDKSREYLDFYAGRTYAPAFMLDRRNLVQEGAITDQHCPVFKNPGHTGDFSKLIKHCADQIAVMDLHIKNEYNATTGDLTITVVGEKYVDLARTTYLNVFLLEDAIYANQVGGGTSFKHDHVVRSILSEAWGDTYEVVDGLFAKTYTVNLDESWNVNNMSVVAFVSDYNSQDINDRTVYNVNAKAVVDANYDGPEYTVRPRVRFVHQGEALTKGAVVKVANTQDSVIKWTPLVRNLSEDTVKFTIAMEVLEKDSTDSVVAFVGTQVLTDTLAMTLVDGAEMNNFYSQLVLGGDTARVDAYAKVKYTIANVADSLDFTYVVVEYGDKNAGTGGGEEPGEEPGDEPGDEKEEVWLTVQDGLDEHQLIFVYEQGAQQKLAIVPAEGYVINTVLFNETDITFDALTNQFILLTLNDNAVLNISYEKFDSSTGAPRESRIKAYGYQGNVVVKGCEAGELITVYDMNGVMVSSECATSNSHNITLPSEAIYVVNVADTVVKVAL